MVISDGLTDSSCWHPRAHPDPSAQARIPSMSLENTDTDSLIPCHLLAHEPKGPRVSSGSSSSLRPLRTILSSRTRDSNFTLSERVGEMGVGDWGCGLGPRGEAGPGEAERGWQGSQRLSQGREPHRGRTLL